jgi:hypothetical protein
MEEAAFQRATLLFMMDGLRWQQPISLKATAQQREHLDAKPWQVRQRL